MLTLLLKIMEVNKMKTTTKVGLVLLIIVIASMILLIFQHKEKKELMSEMTVLEQQLETEEMTLQTISEEIDTQISDLVEILRQSKIAAEKSLSAIVCSDVNMFYSEAQKYLDSFCIRRDELDIKLTEYQLAYEKSYELCSKINSIRKKLEFSEEILQAVSFETKMTRIDELLENSKLKASELTAEAKAYADELYKEYYSLMVQIVACEAGSPYCSNEDQYYVANVVENRIKSKYYPDTIYGVIFQRGQYAPTWDGSWEKRKPDERTKENVERYLRGEIQTGMPENVVYQAMFKQGKGVWKYVSNTVDGGHYFCY